MSKKCCTFAVEIDKRMKKLPEYITVLKELSLELKARFGITSMYLFGSVARGENGPNSDVDILVDMPANFYQAASANDYLEEHLGCHVDMIRNHDRLSAFFRKQIDRDGIQIF